MSKLAKFDSNELSTISYSIETAEELVSEYYKKSSTEWLNSKYDIKTLSDLKPKEIVFGPFAQIIKYIGHPKGTTLKSYSYDLYKICVQDHTILKTLKTYPELELFHFILYIIVHELIHIVRFSNFTQNFKASTNEKLKEETKVHDITHKILTPSKDNYINTVCHFYHNWLIL